jgi:vacuolar-type H+-ATPase subunit I/STV1
MEESRAVSVDRWRELPAGSGIYAIVNASNGDRYVGHARNIRQRIATHVRDLDLGRERTNADMLLQNAWHKFGRSAFVIQVLELVDDNERETVATVRAHNLALAEQFYITQAGAYNKDTKIVRKDQLDLVESKAWRFPIDAKTLESIANARRRAYKVGTRVAFDDAVLVLAHNEDEAKRIARSLSPRLAVLRNLSSQRLTLAKLQQALQDGIPDFRLVAPPSASSVAIGAAAIAGV